MKLSDETLTAYADGELDGRERESVEAALREDPEAAGKVARHRALKARLQDAFAAELDEPVPERLLAAARGESRPTAKVIDFKSAKPAANEPRFWRRPLGSIAASVLLGLALGFGLFRQSGPFTQGRDGSIVARGDLARALSQQLAAQQPAKSRVLLGISYLAKSGDYCRSFSLTGGESPAGIACRHDNEWRVEVLSTPGRGPSGEYRTAGSGLPPVLRQAMEANIQGEPLDAKGEAEARSRGWR